MKKIALLMIAMLATMVAQSIAQDTFYNEAVKWDDGDGWVRYYGTVTMDSFANGDNYHTQAFLTGPLSEGYGYLHVEVGGNTTGTEDVNVFIEHANTPLTTNAEWLANVESTNSALDAVGTAAVRDSIGIIAGTPVIQYHTYLYTRLHFVCGQAQGATGKIIKWSILWMKPEGLKDKTVGESPENTPSS